MKRLFPILFVALLACGFTLPETPAEREARAKDERAWAENVSGRYDLVALLAFLKQTVAKEKSWQDVNLEKPEIGAEWKFGGLGMASGEWDFSAPDPKKDEFTMSFTYHTGKGDRWLILKCVRTGKSSFRLVGIESEEVVVLDP